MVFRESWRFSSPPPFVDGCGLCFEGAGQIWKATRTVGETLDEEDPSGALERVLKRRHLPSMSQHLNSFIYEYRHFRKSAKEVVSPPTSSFSPDNHPSQRKVSFRRPDPPSLTTAAPTYVVPSQLRQFHWSITPAPTPLAFFGLAGVDGVANSGDGHIGTISATGTRTRHKRELGQLD